MAGSGPLRGGAPRARCVIQTTGAPSDAAQPTTWSLRAYRSVRTPTLRVALAKYPTRASMLLVQHRACRRRRVWASVVGGSGDGKRGGGGSRMTVGGWHHEWPRVRDQGCRRGEQ